MEENPAIAKMHAENREVEIRRIAEQMVIALFGEKSHSGKLQDMAISDVEIGLAFATASSFVKIADARKKAIK